MSADRPARRAAAEGLQRHPSLDDRFDPAVRIVDYDPAWPALADAELRRIDEALGEVAVRLEHVGSTAVPGLAAKPILDLQLSVDAIEPRARYVAALERARCGGLAIAGEPAATACCRGSTRSICAERSALPDVRWTGRALRLPRILRKT